MIYPSSGKNWYPRQWAERQPSVSKKRICTASVNVCIAIELAP